MPVFACLACLSVCLPAYLLCASSVSRYLSPSRPLGTIPIPSVPPPPPLFSGVLRVRLPDFSVIPLWPRVASSRRVRIQSSFWSMLKIPRSQSALPAFCCCGTSHSLPSHTSSSASYTSTWSSSDTISSPDPLPLSLNMHRKKSKLLKKNWWNHDKASTFVFTSCQWSLNHYFSSSFLVYSFQVLLLNFGVALPMSSTIRSAKFAFHWVFFIVWSLLGPRVWPTSYSKAHFKPLNCHSAVQQQCVDNHPPGGVWYDPLELYLQPCPADAGMTG